MARAHLTTTNGTKVTIEGTAAEVARLVAEIGGDATTLTTAGPRKAEASKRTKNERPTPVNLIGSLIDGGFFRKPKDLGAVRGALEEMGHVYPVTTLSPILLRLVRRRQLRRIKEQKRWLYTG